MNVYVVSRSRWNSEGRLTDVSPVSAWSTRREANASCERLNRRAGWLRSDGPGGPPRHAYYVARVPLNGGAS